MRLVLSLIVGCFILKLLLQLLSCLPALAPLAHHRFIAIAFLHMIFLGIVTPGLALWAWNAGWIRKGRLSRTGGLLFLTGSIITELMLVLSALAGLAGHGIPYLPELLLAAATIIAGGVLLVRPTVA
jgi:hypothetical protein